MPRGPSKNPMANPPQPLRPFPPAIAAAIMPQTTHIIRITSKIIIQNTNTHKGQLPRLGYHDIRKTVNKHLRFFLSYHKIRIRAKKIRTKDITSITKSQRLLGHGSRGIRKTVNKQCAGVQMCGRFSVCFGKTLCGSLGSPSGAEGSVDLTDESGDSVSTKKARKI